ncbi:hypothetical protein JCM11251_004690 [Rhodosporidiobolus azoricus]
MLVPLTSLDTPTAAVAVTRCWVYGLSASLSSDQAAGYEGRLKAAAERMARKWTLLAGVPPGRWAINVPDDLEETSKSRSLVGFSSTTHDKPYHLAAGLPAPLAPLKEIPSTFSLEPKMPFFVPASVPSSFADHAKRQIPLLHVHLTFFTDAIALGVTLPHGAFDGTGYGLVLKALNAELHGEDWIVPPLFIENPLDRALDALVKDEEIEAQANDLPPSLDGWGSPSFGGIVRLLSSMLSELYWWKAESRWLFLRQAVIDHLVEKVKGEVKEKTGGKEYVSTGDIITAWFLKAAHADESSLSGFVAASPAYNVRSLLATYTTPSGYSPSADLALYPHNSVVLYDLFPSPISLCSLASSSLADLALTFRRNLAVHRTLPALQALQRKLNARPDPSKPALLPQRNWPTFFPSSSSSSSNGPVHRWLTTNQMSLGVADLALPDEDGKDLPLLYYSITGRAPLLLDHALAFQLVKGAGVTMIARVRSSRWESVKRAVEQLEKEVEAATHA